jgi:predicted nuclease of predicted toxin-antitoxin system
LPRRLVRLLGTAHHQAIHTLGLPRANRTSDDELLEICRRENRTLISKDSDFINSFYLAKEPARLLLVSTGNITNGELEEVFRMHLPEIVAALESAALVELDRRGITIRS